MLSRNLVFVGALVVPGMASADVLLGAQFGNQSLDIRQTNALGMVEKDTRESETALGLIVGFGRPGGGDRILIEWNGFTVEDRVEVDLLEVSYNYFLPNLTQSNVSKLRPFIGGSLGYGWLDVSSMPGYASGDDGHILYGVRTGLNLALGNWIEFEVGMRYTAVDLDAELDSRLPLPNSAHYEVSNSRAWWIGFSMGI